MKVDLGKIDSGNVEGIMHATIASETDMLVLPHCVGFRAQARKPEKPDVMGIWSYR